jgi:iron only hydrogenase large subunit-like protein
VKSPQAIAGTLVKYWHAASAGVPPERVCHVSVMPCFDKKLEAARDDFFNPDAGSSGSRDVDCVLSTGEIVQLLEDKGLGSLAESADAPADAAPPLSGLTESGASLALASPGASGGAAEYVYRVAARELFGVELPPGPLPWVQGKNADLHELTLSHEGETVLRFVRAYGFRNIQNVARRAKSGRCPYHLVEMMACPGGCANGGGQPRPPRHEAIGRTRAVEARFASPEDTVPRPPQSNPAAAAMYAAGGFLEGGAHGERAQRHLLTSFHAVDASKQNPLTITW